MDLKFRKIFLYFCIVFVSIISITYAQQNIEGPIGLFESVAKYTFYSKDFTINTVETNVMSFEVLVTLDASESGDFYLSVDGVYCNPDKISYPSATRYQISFDCKGSISKETDSHTVRFYSTTDLTNVKVDYRMLYTKKQTLRLSVYGTEYHPGDIATIFLHLTDENSQPIDNSTCFVSVWDPDKIKIIDEADMSYLDDGIYYFDMPVPWEAGVYMISAYCVLPMYIHYNYTHYTFAYDGFECGGWDCGYGWGDDWYHEGRSDVGSYSPYNGSYELRLRGGNGYVERSLVNLCDAENVTLTLHWRANSFESADEAYLNFWDGSWHTIHTWRDGDDDNAWHTLTINLSDLDLTLCTNILAIDATGLSGSGDYLYIDDIKVEGYRKEYYETNESVYQFVRGSGELHVSPRDTGCFPETAGFYYPNDLVFVQVKSDAPEVEIWVYNENKTLVAYGNATPFSSVHRIWFYNMTAPSESGLYTVYAKCTYDGYKSDGITTFYVSPTQLTLIQGKLDDVYNYLTDTVYTLLVDINNTVHNLNITYSGNVTVNLTSIENKLDYIINNMATKDQIDEVQQNITSLYDLIEQKWQNYTAQDIMDKIDSVGNDILNSLNEAKSMINCTAYSGLCSKIDEVSNKVDLVLSNISVIIYKEDLIMGNVSSINQNTEWLVQCLNVSCDNSWIDARFDSIDASLSNIASDISEVNQTLNELNSSAYFYYWDIMYKLETMQQELHSINITGNITVENLTQIIDRLRDMNRTLVLHDEFVRGDLKNEVRNIETMVDDLDDYIYINITNSIDEVDSKVSQLLGKWGNLTAQDLYDKMNQMHSLINQIYNEMATYHQSELILGNVTYLINYMESKYGSYDWSWLDSKLSNISSDLGDVSSLIIEHNETMYNEIVSVKNKIDSIWGSHDADEIISILNEVNYTVSDTNYFLKNDIENKLDNITSITTDIKDSIGSSNDNTTSTLFGYLNVTYSKLQDIYDNLIELKNEYNKTLIEEIKSSVDDLKEMHNCSTFNTTICNLLDQISNGVTKIEGSIITNMEVTQLVYPGTQFKATITIVHISGAPVDADNITVKIYDPSQNLVYQGSPQHHESQGAYKFEWSVPANPALGVYTIYADITIGNITTVEYDVFRVAQTGPFDVIVKVLKKQVTSASFVPAEITVQNKGEVGVDATVTYWIEDSLGNVISSAQETWFVPADGEVVKDVQLYVPSNAKVGTYYFKAKALYDITRPPATGYDTFYVVKQIGVQPSGISGGTYPALQAVYHNVTFNMSIPMTVQVLYKGQLIREEYLKPMESMLLKEGEYTFAFRAKGYHPVMITVKVDKDLVVTVSPEKITGGVFPSVPFNFNTFILIAILSIIIYMVVTGR